MLNGDIVGRVVMEYIEMPGLALTHRQAARLWNLDAGICREVLDHLVREQFLAESSGGVFLRRTSGRVGPITALPPPGAAAAL